MVGPRLECLAAAGVPAGNDPVTAQRGSQRRRCCPRSTPPTVCRGRLSRAAAEPAFAYGYT